jgi:hypothetical protein
MNVSVNWIYLNLETSYHFSLSAVGLASFNLLLDHLWYWRTCSLINFGAQAAALTYLYDVTCVVFSFYFYCLYSFQLGKWFCFHTGWIMVIDVYVTSSVKIWIVYDKDSFLIIPDFGIAFIIMEISRSIFRSNFQISLISFTTKHFVSLLWFYILLFSHENFLDPKFKWTLSW